MATSHDSNRRFLLCPVCKKTQASLSQHLRRVCMKKDSADKIMSVVKKAKADAHEVLASGCIFSFDLIKNIMEDTRPIYRMIKELEKRHMVVKNIPMNFESSVVGPQTGETLVQPPKAEMTEQSEEVASSSGETFQCESNVGWETENRQLMLETGLNQKHSRDHKLLQDFATYLQKDLKVENYKQDVDNVARYLYYMDPCAPSLNFVMEKKKTKQYLRDLTEAKVMKQTQFSFLKNLKCFLNYHAYETNLKQRDPVLHGFCADFIGFLGLQLSICCNQVSKEIIKKKYWILTTESELTTAEQEYRTKMINDTVQARLIRDAAAAGDSSNSSERESRSGKARASTSCNPQMDVQTAFEKLLEEHPVSLDGIVPSKEERASISQLHQRKLYERWLKAQMKLRTQHVLEHFSHRLPSEHHVEAWIKSRGWKNNSPRASSIVMDWKPSRNVQDAINSDRIKRSIKTQKWSGLLVRDIKGKSRGVVTTRDFQQGEVVCDYHGKAVTVKEDKSFHAASSVEETGYTFFYKKEGLTMCIDAHQEHCDCHPEKQTTGRLINHLRKRCNLKPRLYTITDEGVEKDVILFFASRDIPVDQELLFDYRVKKQSFKGDGQDLEWLK